jgi:hypothetical protein
MVDVKGAADFIVGLPPQKKATYYNYGPDIYVTPEMIPKGFSVLHHEEWLQAAPLSDAERALIATDPLVLRATSQFEHAAAQAAWQKITASDFAASSDPKALVAARFTSS